jgi:hypothetical protein
MVQVKKVRGYEVHFPKNTEELVELSKASIICLVGMDKTDTWATGFGNFLAFQNAKLREQSGDSSIETALAFVYFTRNDNFRSYLDDFRGSLWTGYVKNGLAVQIDRNHIGADSMKFFPSDYQQDDDDPLSKKQIEEFLAMKSIDIAYTFGMAQGIMSRIEELHGYRPEASIPVWTVWPPEGKNLKATLSYSRDGLVLASKKSDDVQIPWRFISEIGIGESEYLEQHGFRSTTHRALTFSIELLNGATFERHFLLGSEEDEVNRSRIYIRGYIRGIMRNRYPVSIVQGSGYVASGGYTVGVGVGMWF